MATKINIPEEYLKLNRKEIDDRIIKAKRKLGDKLVILGHHYQMDSVIKFADFTGDSLALCKIAQTKKNAKYIVFCGVHFMAESAFLLGQKDQIIILPDMEAGCSMADMANINQVEKVWKDIKFITKNFVPITYINSAASLKAFCGKNNGAVCTSSNAGKIMKWVFDQDKKVMFFPDEHLGRYTAIKHGIKEDEIISWDFMKQLGGNTKNKIKKAKVILWKGYCYVHQKFRAEHIDKLRKQYPNIKVIVHPECGISVIKKSDFVGSTNYIIETIEKSPKGSIWAVGTEMNLVNRLIKNNPDKKIILLSQDICLCSTMKRITPQHLLWSLESILKTQIVNQIIVPTDTAKYAKLALDRMMEITDITANK